MPDLHAAGVEFVAIDAPLSKACVKIGLDVLSSREAVVADEQPPSRCYGVIVGLVLGKDLVYEFPVLRVKRVVLRPAGDILVRH